MNKTLAIKEQQPSTVNIQQFSKTFFVSQQGKFKQLNLKNLTILKTACQLAQAYESLGGYIFSVFFKTITIQ